VEEGQKIEAGKAARRSEKVVRLPRDWLGPRENLVPFGAAIPPAVEPPSADIAPSADAFWGGEHSASVHAAVQPLERSLRADPPPPLPTPEPRPRRRRVVGAAAALAVAVAAALGFLTAGSSPHLSGGAKLNIAAIWSSGVARIARVVPPRVVSPSGAHRSVKHVSHRSPRPKPTPATAHHHTSSPPPSTYVAHSTPASAQPTYDPSVSAPTHQVESTPPPASSGATVSPTGQAGALGPVQSPNG